MVVGYGGAQLIRLLGNLILTRLLFEEAFGVMALIERWRTVRVLGGGSA